MMCGRYYIDNEEENYKLRAILQEIDRRRLQGSEGVHTGEVCPGQIAPVILAEDGAAAVRPMRWGFPRVGGGGLVINSRSEKADTTPMFQKAARERRCLVPVSGFFEWKRTESGAKTKDKYAFTVERAKSGGLMYLAGFYGDFMGGFEAGGYTGFVVLTRAADEQMSPYHDRMPVSIGDEALKKNWLFAPPEVPYDELRRMLSPERLLCERAG